ncbi:MAG: hypothetical protein QOF45_2852 [Gaiellaceae bacterium]|jgi:hypothetical protein|nr:hypothetical protein [Gaiellaceae bacterium]
MVDHLEYVNRLSSTGGKGVTAGRRPPNGSYEALPRADGATHEAHRLVPTRDMTRRHRSGEAIDICN